MDLEQGVRLVIVLVIFVFTTISNASVGVLMYRFKNLRTVPNLFILSSCIADILNQVFNIPGFAAGYIAKDNKYFVGRALALALSTFNLFFISLNLMSMTVMMVDRLCAFKFDIAYRVWRTRSKAFKVIAFKWIFCFVSSMVLLIPIWDIDLGDEPTYKYRKVHFAKRGNLTSLFLFSFFIFCNGAVAIFTCYVIRHKNKINTRKMGLKKSTLEEARKLSEINAIKTIGITAMVFFACYLPVTVFGILDRKNIVSSYSWFAFTAFCICWFVPGMMNPFIYAIRTRRFRRALKSFLKDPCGSSDIPQ